MQEFLKIYPTAGRYWKQYIEHELSSKNFDNVEKLFQRSLRQCLHIDLWKTYIRYILDFKAKNPNSREEVLRAFEFALAHVGLDINANQFWADYIAYVKSLKVFHCVQFDLQSFVKFVYLLSFF
jgi:cleavage stimulation factor subunit 3